MFKFRAWLISLIIRKNIQLAELGMLESLRQNNLLPVANDIVITNHKVSNKEGEATYSIYLGRLK